MFGFDLPLPTGGGFMSINHCDTCNHRKQCKVLTLSKLKDKILYVSASDVLDLWQIRQLHREAFPSEVGMEFLKLTKRLGECQQNFIALLQKDKPLMTVALGDAAIKWLYEPTGVAHIKYVSFSNLQGLATPVQEYGLWFFAITSDFLREHWLPRILKEQLNRIKAPFPKITEDITLIEKEIEAISLLERIITDKPTIAFDYETTGIKPEFQGHRIITVSLALRTGNKLTSYAFPYFGTSGDFTSLWAKILADKEIPKICQNAGFEAMWSLKRCGVKLEGVIWDTMVASHCTHNMTPKGLEFRAFAHLGARPYSQVVNNDLKSKENQGANGLNELARIPENTAPKSLLRYNALDSFYTYKLYEFQRAYLEDTPHLLRGAEFFMQVGLTLSHITSNGINVDLEAMEESKTTLAKEVWELEQEIDKIARAEGWLSVMPFNSDKQAHLEALLYSGRYTKPETSPFAKESLEHINNPIIQPILKYRELSKLLNTYLGQIERETNPITSTIHPMYSITSVDTFRTSSQNPNFQNIPVRSEAGKKYIRSLFKPSEGNILVEWDYSSVEVGVGCCYHKDPQMVEYLLNEDADMHADTACDLFKIPRTKVTPRMRRIAKNSFVFPIFYGASSKSIAPNIWNSLSVDELLVLQDSKLDKRHAFFKHIAQYEKDFWGKRFGAYGRWRNALQDELNAIGYIEQFTGFRCHAPMTFTQLVNRPVQGSAAHTLLWTLSKVTPLIEGLSGRSRIIGQIHDSMLGDVHPDEFEQIHKLVLMWGTERVRRRFPELYLPLRIDAQVSEVNGTWAEMKDYEP